MVPTLPGSHFLPTPVSGAPCPVESGRQCIAYLQSCPKQSGLHQSPANVEDLRSLCNTQIPNISHNEHFMKRRIQRRNRIPQGRAKLGPLQGFRWRIAPIREILGKIVAFLILRLLVDGVVQKLVILAALPTRLICSDLDELNLASPRKECRCTKALRNASCAASSASASFCNTETAAT